LEADPLEATADGPEAEPMATEALGEAVNEGCMHPFDCNNPLLTTVRTVV
jgi:hypothetical protein